MAKELVIITRYFVPHEVVDSDAVYQMIAGIQETDSTVKIHVITTNSKYKSNALYDGKFSQKVLDRVTVHTIKARPFKSASTLLKFLSNLSEGFQLVKKAKSLHIKNVISLSNPPLIVLWCTLLLKKLNFFYWTFDLFPDALVADEILSKKSILYKFFKWVTYKNPPAVLISLGEYQCKYLRRKFKSDIPFIKLPCGIHDNLNRSSFFPAWHNNEDIFIGYIGNMGRAHSLPFLQNVISHLAGKKGVKLILSIYGFHKEAVLEHLKIHMSENIIIVDYLDKSQLNAIDIHLVSLKNLWNNISVPSKAVSAVCSGSALWFCGPDECDTWSMFNECSYKSTEEFSDVEKTFSEINIDDIKAKKSKATKIKNELLKIENDAYASIVDKL